MTQIQFSFFKKIKIGRLEHWLTRHPFMSNNISFLPYLPLTPKSGRHMCITPNKVLWKRTDFRNLL